MNEEQHHALRIDLGAYALGQLGEDERRALERHLDGCASCTAELGELVPVVAALEGLRDGRAGETDVRPPAELGDRVVAGVAGTAREERRSARLRTLGRYAGTAAAAAVLVVATTLALDRDQDAPAPTVPLEAVPVQVSEPGLSASADLVDHTWGVEVKLTATGFRTGGRYEVAVLGRDGSRHDAGGFVGTGPREMACNLSSDLLRDRASGFEVRDAAGTVVATSTFGRPSA